MPGPTLSVTICVLNEELLLGKVLSSVSTLADEVIVVDTGSTDATVEIARNAGAKVILYHQPDYLKAWNVALEAASCDWVLNLDGDEVIGAVDLPELRRLLRTTDHNAFYLRTRNYSTFMDLAYKWCPNDGRYPELEGLSRCPGYWTSYPLRLFRRHPGVRFRVGATNHTKPDPSILELGWSIGKTETTLHNLGVMKGGDRYLAQKNAARLQGELEYTERGPLDEVNLARTYFFQGNDEAALRHLDAALKLSPSFIDALYIKALVHKEGGDLELAQDALLDVLCQDEEHSDAWMILGMVHQLQGRPFESEGALLRSLAIHPTHPLAHNSLAIAYEDQGCHQKAEASYLRALEYHPQLPCGLENLAGLYEQLGRVGEGKELRRRLDEIQEYQRLN